MEGNGGLRSVKRKNFVSYISYILDCKGNEKILRDANRNEERWRGGGDGGGGGGGGGGDRCCFI